MTTATATAEKTVFKRETLELKNIHVYTQNDRINQDSRVGDRAYDKGLVKDILFSPMLWATPEFSSSYVTQIQIKGTRIYDSLCSYTGVRTYFYKLANSEFGCMYQKRPYPQNDFLLIFANLTQMFNDAVCYFGNNSNKNAFQGLNFDIESGVSRFNLQQRLLEFYKKSKRQLTISETTRGMLGDSNLRYNIFVRNQPKLDKHGKPLKCAKKLIKLYKERGTVAIYGGDCISPLKLVKHQQIKLESENGKFSYTTDFITLYSVEQDMYTLYIPYSVLDESYGTTNKFYGLHLTQEEAEKIIPKLLERTQKYLNHKKG